MTENLFETTVGVAELLPLFQCPDWMSVRLDPGLSRDGRRLSEIFLRTFALILGRRQPRRAAVSCVSVDGVLHVMFDFSPRRGDLEHATLSSLAESLQELHNRRLAAELRDHTQPARSEVPDFDLPDVDGGLDLLGLVTGPRALEPIDVFKFAENAEQLEQRIKGRDGEAGRRIAQTLERLALSGISRPMAPPPADWLQRLDALVESFPSFVQVIETAIRPHITLCAQGLPHRLAPILLVGGPGIGKTTFANALAALLGTPPPLFVSMAAETNGSSISGSSTFWSNSSPGQVFEFIAWGRAGHDPVANGLIVLDEIDKAHTTGYSGLGPLYSLLEEHTSKFFVDQSLPDLIFDASHLRLIATANNADEIPAALRSRMLVFEISPPSAGQLMNVARQILAELIRKMRVQFSADLPAALSGQIGDMSPRAIKHAAEIAFARAVMAGRSHLVEEDWPALRMDERQPARRAAMGFVHS
ncbi:MULTISPECIES: AAA family ATPase [unclassified Acidovorax]|uniref:AAA family ATPase n=1 Tax=unclassified Acidovorax TaxID=2684926 RepID=UPI000B3F8A35|nr:MULTISPECIES: AAA family ATPase [unclassified Acidovorax]